MADTPKHPDRPMLFPGDFPKEPPPEKTLETLQGQWEKEIQEDYPSVVFENSRAQRQEALQRAEAAPLGYGHQIYPRPPEGAASPREREQMAEFEAETHLAMGGAGEQSAPVAVQGGSPFKFGG